MRTRSRKFHGFRRTWIVAAAVAGACSLYGTDPTTGFRQDAIDETLRQENLWKASGVHGYDFVYQRLCPCSSKATQQVHIQVRNDLISHVLDTAGVEVTPQADIPWPTVDSLFLWSKQLLNENAWAVDVSFDTTAHYPIKLFGDNRVSTITHTAGGLVVVP